MVMFQGVLQILNSIQNIYFSFAKVGRPPVVIFSGDFNAVANREGGVIISIMIDSFVSIDSTLTRISMIFRRRLRSLDVSCSEKSQFEASQRL
jgi:hypothetical protein